ncbi:glycosyltransferase family 39 protein [Litoribacter ruber]|uniref:ArnT family glycosyltransferase n=1 Tax=Litoribacter ruber TaxID=702568 RepID=UPI001BDB5F4D|nr:glycosyltransferase family 39 protein [Litoribacter ruber]MBT0810015.1 glycosyltransferase family 39 protein [Litoribacter ruber]
MNTNLTEPSNHTSTQLFLLLLFAGLFLTYIFALFVPLMDSDSAHHANIALHMVLTGDYISLIDKGKPYLDKPHLLFWTSAASFNLFGINAFAYKFPSFLFTSLGLYSTFRLGSGLYDKKTGWLATAILATSFAFILANSDVRMDAMLTASMIFAAWQAWGYYQFRSWPYLAGTALGLSLGFMTKGMIGPAVPVFAFLFYLVEKKDWKFFLDYKAYLAIPLFFIFSSPVLYAYYIQFDLNPDLVIRGRENISGIKFILWDQNFERFDGETWGGDGSKDYLFFLHTILWAFLPWSFLFYFGIAKGLKQKLISKTGLDWMTMGTLIFLLGIYSLAGFKLPHYLNTLFPFMAIVTAAALVKFEISPAIRNVQYVVLILITLLAITVNVFAFPSWAIILPLSIAAVYLAYWKKLEKKWASMVMLSLSVSVVVNMMMQVNFYPQLLKYQGGTALAKEAERMRLDKEQTYFFEMHSYSFDFQSKHLHKRVTYEDILDKVASGPIFLYVNNDGLNFLQSQTNLQVDNLAEKGAFHVSRLKSRFLNPSTREKALTPNYLIEVRSSGPLLANH